MKKQNISININKIKGNDKGYADLELIFNKEEKKKEGETWELWTIGFITTKAPKGEKGDIVGNISEFRYKEQKPVNSFGDVEQGEGINPDDIPF